MKFPRKINGLALQMAKASQALQALQALKLPEQLTDGECKIILRYLQIQIKARGAVREFDDWRLTTGKDYP